MKKTVYATLGVLLAGFLLLWTLGSCPGLMDDPPSPPVPDTDPDRTIRLYGTVSEANGRLSLKIPLPQTETAAGRVLFAGNWTTKVTTWGTHQSDTLATSGGTSVMVLDKDMVPKIVNYYELILRRHGIDPNTHVEGADEESKVYRKDTALTSRKNYLRIAVEVGDVYDVLLLAGYKDDQTQTKVLLASAYNDNGGQGFTMVQGANLVELQLYRTLVALSFPSDSDQLAQFILSALYTPTLPNLDWFKSRQSWWTTGVTLDRFRDNAELSGGLGNKLAALYDLFNDTSNLTTNWNTATQTAIQTQMNGAFAVYNGLVNSGAPELIYNQVAKDFYYRPVSKWNGIRTFSNDFRKIGQLLEQVRGKVDTLLNTPTDETQRTALATEIKNRIYDNSNDLISNLGDIGRVLPVQFSLYSGGRWPRVIYHEGPNTPLRILTGTQLSSPLMTRELAVKVNLLDSAAMGEQSIGLKPLYDSATRVSGSMVSSPFPLFTPGGFPIAADTTRYMPSRDVPAGPASFAPFVSTAGPHTYNVGGDGSAVFVYTARLPPGDADGKFAFNLQYYPFGNPFPADGTEADTQGKITKTIETFGLPWNIRSGLNHDQEAVYMPSSGPVYSIGGAIRVIVGDGPRDENTYLTIDLLH